MNANDGGAGGVEGAWNGRILTLGNGGFAGGVTGVTSAARKTQSASTEIPVGLAAPASQRTTSTSQGARRTTAALTDPRGRTDAFNAPLRTGT